MKLPAYPRTKPSGVEWLGDVPEHWATWKFAHLFRSAMGQTILKEEVADAGSIPVLSATEQYEIFGYLDDARVILNEGDLVIPARGSIGYVKLVRQKSTSTQTTIYAKPITNTVHPEFAFYFLNGYRPQLFPYDKTAIPQLTVGHVSSNPFLLPPILEQRSIAAFLDRETGRVDRLMAKKRELIERMKEKRTALISRTVTRGLPPAAALAAGLPANPPLKPSALAWLGDIPAHWEVKKLSWLFRYAKGPSAAMLTKEYVADNVGDYPVFSGQTENEGLMGMIDWHEFTFASPVIFVTTVGARAMSTRIVSGKFSLSQNCALIIPRNKNANPRYYEAVLRGLFDYERRSISLIMQPSLRFDDLDKFRVPLPPPEEQTAIAAYLDAETAKLDGLVGKVEEAVERLQEYRTALITAAVTGKIDVRKEVA